MLYGDYAAAAGVRLPDAPRRHCSAARSVKVAANWVVTGAARWDLVANKINQYVIGAGYVDDCFVLAANYVTSYSYAAGTTAARAQSRVHAADRPAHHRQFGRVGDRSQGLQ